MRSFVLAALLIGASSAVSAEPDGTKFWGHVQKDSKHVISYYVTVPPGETANLSAANGMRLEFRAGPAAGESGQAEVRLFDEKGKLLHERTLPGTGPINLSGSYSICRGSMTYMSPSPSEPSEC